MRKYKVIKEEDYTDFSDRGLILPKTPDEFKQKLTKSIVPASIGTFVLPLNAFAADVNGTFGNVHGAVMNAFDSGVVIIVIFAGAAWGLGHRSKAMEILIGVCCGYVLARHAIDVRDFLKSI